MRPQPIKFGTEGWRAVIAADYTYANVRRCADAVARELNARSGGARQTVVVGFDTRFMSDKFAYAAAETLAKNGVDALLFDRPAPTPSCALAVRDRGAQAGVMITASHNPPEWNGFKVKASFGGSAPSDQIARIEGYLERADGETSDAGASGAKTGTITPFDPLPGYIDSLRQSVNLAKIQSAGLNIIADAMHGAGAGVLNRVAANGASQNSVVEEIRSEPNPAFPGMKQPEPIDENLTPLKQRVAATAGASVGIAFDGDADRLGVVDENGRYMSAGEVFAILVYQTLERRAKVGPIVCTITMSSMIDKIARRYNAKAHRTPVGFKYVAPVMMSENCVIAGEESGGYAFSGHIPDRDGVASALVFLEAMAQSGKSPTELLRELHDLVGEHAYYREDLTISDAQRQTIAQALADYKPDKLRGMKVVSVNRSGGMKVNLTDDGWWVACRLSGTEPLLRVYAEAPDRQTAQELVADFKTTLKI